MRTRNWIALLLVWFGGPLAPAAVAAEPAPNPWAAAVTDARPRIFLRAGDGFDGLTVAKLRERSKSPEFVAAGARENWRSRPIGRGLLWLLDGDKQDLAAAVAGLKKMDADGGTWSDRGLDLIRLAALFDWVCNDLDEPTRRETIAKIEWAADAAVVHLSKGQAPFFYSRTPGAVAGLAVAGLSLHGVSDKADGYLAAFRRYGVNEYFKAYDWVDGAATGATYTLHYTYTALPSLMAAWWSATGQNPVEWVRANQGGWLDQMARFETWYLRPGFAFTNLNDQFRGDWDTHDEYASGLDMLAYLTRDGQARAYSQRWLARHGNALYHPYCAEFLIFRDPSIATKPLSELPKAELFGRDSCGYGFFRSDWPADGQPDTATQVFFRLGDPMDVHGGVAAGEFQVFRRAPLAARGGKYGPYDAPSDQYHRNAASANVVLFADRGNPDDRGDQHSRRGLKDDQATWDQWLKLRERNKLDVATITDWRVAPGEARCRADLTKANPGKAATWEREFVWLADKHLVVLDVVETAKPDVRVRWQLHAAAPPALGERTITVENTPPDKPWADASLKPKTASGRLYCQTLLPRQYVVTSHVGGKAEAFDPAGKPVSGGPSADAFHLKFGKNVVQVEPTGEARRVVFLHVLTAVDAEGAKPPAAAWRVEKPGTIEVTVDGAKASLQVPAWATE
ncbi:MAG TPA: hypothetical protein VF796_20120 [Humisphaera sp.]